MSRALAGTEIMLEATACRRLTGACRRDRQVVEPGRAESRRVRVKDDGFEGARTDGARMRAGQRRRLAPPARPRRCCSSSRGTASCASAASEHSLEPETGVNLAPGQEYEVRNEASDPLRIVCVQVRGPAPRRGGRGRDGADGARARTWRWRDRRWPDTAGRARGAWSAGWLTSKRRPPPPIATFRIVADPSTGLRSATHFVGYVPTARAPDHFHTYDEVIYVLEGEGAFHAGGTSRPIGAGSCIELPARTVHCLENTGEGVMRLVAVFRPPGSPAAAYYPDGTPAYPGTPPPTI